jgi:glyoxylate reductase
VGFGRIGRAMARRATGFQMKVIYSDAIRAPLDVEKELHAEYCDFNTLLGEADFVSVHVPLLPDTRGLFDGPKFFRMKPTAFLINTSRGPVVDEAALAAALDAKQLAGAALDVLEQEPPVNSPLFGRENVILTPHTSFYSVESLEELQTKAAEEVVRVLTGQPPRNPVNPEALATPRAK